MFVLSACLILVYAAWLDGCSSRLTENAPLSHGGHCDQIAISNFLTFETCATALSSCQSACTVSKFKRFAAAYFFSVFHSQRLPRYATQKIIGVMPAVTQGFDRQPRPLRWACLRSHKAPICINIQLDFGSRRGSYHVCHALSQNVRKATSSWIRALQKLCKRGTRKEMGNGFVRKVDSVYPTTQPN